MLLFRGVKANIDFFIFIFFSPKSVDRVDLCSVSVRYAKGNSFFLSISSFQKRVIDKQKIKEGPGLKLRLDRTRKAL